MCRRAGKVMPVAVDAEALPDMVGHRAVPPTAGGVNAHTRQVVEVAA
jgi:hypothetical protein